MCHVRQSDRRHGSASVTSHIAHRTSHISGFTLLEVLVSAVILTATTAAIVMPFSLAAEQQQLDARRTVAAELATQMLERLATLTHTERLTYNGRNESGLAITGIDGQPLNDETLVGFTLGVGSVEIALPLGTETADDAPKYCRATATVTFAGMAPVTLGRLFYAE
ncbi:MAG: hypothetical protein WC058_09240 [Phycisphaeraceae bacterium]